MKIEIPKCGCGAGGVIAPGTAIAVCPKCNGARAVTVPLPELVVEAASPRGDKLYEDYPIEYAAWKAARSRCRNPKHFRYPLYGGRGIRFSEAWDSFSVFLAELGPRPGSGFSLDRINNDGNYEPGNCRWATAREQMLNRRTDPDALQVTLSAKFSDQEAVNARRSAKALGITLSELIRQALGDLIWNLPES